MKKININAGHIFNHFLFFVEKCTESIYLMKYLNCYTPSMQFFKIKYRLVGCVLKM